MKRVIDSLSLQSPAIDQHHSFAFQGNYNRQDVHQPDDCSWHPCQTIIVPHEEQKKKWLDLDADRRKQLKVRNSLLSLISSLSGHSRLLQIGGWLLAGAATIGAGYHAWDNKGPRTEEEVGLLPYSHSDISLLNLVTETSFHVGLQRWQRDAYVRTEEFRNHGPRAPTIWVLVDGRDKIPKSAIEAGKDKNGHPVYFARVLLRR